MNKNLFFTFLFVINTALVIGQIKTEILTPNFNDEYSNTVKNLELGKSDIDYKKFRESFIESEQFKIANRKFQDLSDLKKKMYSQMANSDFDSIVSTTKKMLSIDYTNMTAHKILRQTYQILGDTINAKKYKQIQFGLLKSIVDNGDGKSCETAWPVIQISEEYYILEMLDAKLSKQSIDNNGGVCDKMEVDINGDKVTYYFEISKIFEGRKK